MEVVLGIAAKSLDAACELAKALDGCHAWGYEQSIALPPEGMHERAAAPAVTAQARLLLSRDFRTGYVLVATHASAADLVRAAASAAAASPAADDSEQQNAHHAEGQDGERLKGECGQANPSDAEREGDGDSRGAVRGAGSRRAEAPASDDFGPLSKAPVPPLQRLQQLHGAGVNVLLLQLFLVCDVVLVQLPTGQGLGTADAGGGGGGGGGPLAGMTDWMARLRLLQAARRALHHAVTGGGGTRAQGPAQHRTTTQPLQADLNADEASRLLGSWCRRPAPPLLLFVSPADPAPAMPASPAAPRAPVRGSGAAESTDTREAYWVLRGLLKRCRPVPLAAPTEPWVLCSFDLQNLLLEPGPLTLSPAQVHATVLEALLGPYGGSEYDSSQGLPMSGLQVGNYASGAAHSGLQGLRLAVAGALRAVADTAATDVTRGGERPGTWRWGAAAAQALLGGGGAGGGSCGGDLAAAAVAAAERLGAGWRAAAAALFEAAQASWCEAAGRPLDWAAPSLALALAPGSRAPTPSSQSDRSAASRGRTRGQPGMPSDPSSSSAAQPSLRLPSPLEPVGACLALGAGGCGLAARMASELCQAAADSAVRQYMYGMPPRYPARVHAAAVAAAVAALCAAAPPGPAVGPAAAALAAACEQAWRDGRRQCSALSVTGRPCTRPAHGPHERHSSDTVIWVTATTTGSALLSVPDPFDLQEANCSPRLDDGAQVAVAAPPPGPAAGQGTAAGTGAGAGRPKQAGGAGGGAKKGRPTGDLPPTAPSTAVPATPPADAPPPHSTHLVVAVAQDPEGGTRQCILGPWAAVTRLGPATTYNDRRGLTNQPGLQGGSLFALALPLGADAGPGQRQGSAAAAAGGPGAGRGGVGRATGRGSAAAKGTASAASRGPETPDATSAAGGSDSETGVVLDEQSFPSLAAAVAKAGARPGAGGPGGAAAGRRGAGKQAVSAGHDPVAATGQERESLARVWPYPYGSGGGGGDAGHSGGGGGGDGGGGGAEAPRPREAQGGVRGRRTRGSANAVASAGIDPAAFPSLQGARDVRKLYIGYEYQTLDGRRFLATPQQLAAAGVGGPAAATSGPSAGRSTSEPRARSSTPTSNRVPSETKLGRGRGGVTPTAHAAAGAAPTSASAAAWPAPSGLGAAALAAGGGGGGGNAAAAAFLIQHDAPLFLSPPPGLVSDTQGTTTFQDGAPAWDPTPRRPAGLAQLQRIHLVTPPSACGEPLLAVRPTVHFKVLQPPQLPADAVEAMLLTGPPLAHQRTSAAPGDASDRDGDEVAASAGATGVPQQRTEGVSAPGPAVTAVQFTLARPVALPPDSVVVVSLPYAYGLPADWLGWGADGACTAQGQGGGAAASGLRQAGTGDEGLGSDVGGRGSVAAGVSGGASEGRPAVQQTVSLVPLVQLDQRLPFEAHLVAGSAVFPIPAAAKPT